MRPPNVVVVRVDHVVRIPIRGQARTCHAQCVSPYDIVGGIHRAVDVVIAGERTCI